MPLNNPTPVAAVRMPFARILINGTPLLNWENVNIAKNSHFVSDNWHIEIPFGALVSPMDIAFWGTQTDLEFEAQVGFKNADGSLGTPVSLIVGLVDEIDENFITDEGKQMIELRGRDYSGPLIDSIVTDSYVNMTSSQVAQKIVANHPQLTGKITATKKIIGKYFNDQASLSTRKQSEWDLLTELAQFEGYVVLIQGRTLYFGAPPTPDTSNPYVFKYVPRSATQTPQANVLTLKCNRSLTIARDVKVIVQSFSRSTGKTVKSDFTALNPLRANRTGNKAGVQIYTYNVPNLTKAQAQQYASAKAAEITLRERIVEIKAPGDTLLTPDAVVQLTGTGTDWDQLYYSDRIVYDIDVDGGFVMTYRGKNHSTASQVPT